MLPLLRPDKRYYYHDSHSGVSDVVGLDLLQLPCSSHGSGYILVCVDPYSWFVVLALLRGKSAGFVAQALVSHS